MAYGVVRTDLMQGTDVRTGLVSLKYQPSGTDTAIENGNVVLLGALISGEREVRAAATPAANSALHDIALVATPEVMYDERKKNLDEFRNEAGEIARGYILHSGDIFGVTKDALDGAASPAVGDVVELKAGTKLNVVAAATGATSGSTVIGSIWAIETAGRYTYYVIKVA